MGALHLNRAALDRMVKAESAQQASRRVAEHVGDKVEAQHHIVGDTDADGVGVEIDLPVEVYDRDQGGAAVVLAHPAGHAIQAKYGALTRAAAESGLEVGR